MASSNNWYTLRAIVEQCMIDLGVDMSAPNKARYMSWAIMGYRQLQLNVYKQIKTGIFPLSEINTVDLPSDYVQYSRIGLQVGSKILEFSSNNNIALEFTLDEDGNETPNPFVSMGYRPNGINTNNYINMNNYWGAGFNNIPVRDYFRIDLNRGRIIFSTHIELSQIYMEYIADGLDCIEETLVNPMAYEVIRCYVHLQRVKFSRSGTLAERQMWTEAHKTAISAFQLAKMDLNIQGIRDVSNEFYSLGAKR